MSQVGEILKMIERLSAPERAELEARLAERIELEGERNRIADEVREARDEFKRGKASRAGVEEIVREIDS